ncbi:MAG: hypothetical protein AB1774_09355 [Bacillota bacterium]
MGTLYALSDYLKSEIAKVADKVEQGLPCEPRLVEYVTPPQYGEIVLRFDATASTYEGACECEVKIRKLVGEAYWVTLMGNIYSRFGVEFRSFSDDLVAINCSITDSQPRKTKHSLMVKRDAAIVKRVLGLGHDREIWEIEIPVTSPSELPEIRIIQAADAERHDTLTTGFAGATCRVTYLPISEAYSGLVKAYREATRRHLALLDFIRQFREGERSHS